MSNLENELKDLRENNNELVQKVQYWKMTAAQRENENIELMKEVTELRYKLNTLRNRGDAQAHKLDAALQGTTEEVLSHLVQASNAVARTLELVKTYMHDRHELESSLPRWSTLSDSNSTKKINKVRPMLIGGRNVQPFVLLDRTLDGENHTVEASRNQSPNIAERAIPMHMLLDVYIPLRRIDADDFPTNEENDEHIDHGDDDDNVERLGLEEADNRISDESHNITVGEVFEESRRLDAVSEDVEPEEEEQTPQRPQADPLEGPSWLLDRPNPKVVLKRRNLEPDSTTGTEEEVESSSRSSYNLNNVNPTGQVSDPTAAGASAPGLLAPPGPSAPGLLAPPGPRAPPGPVLSPGGGSVFSPTVRRRRRASPPPPPSPRSPLDHFSPHLGRRSSSGGRILKVLVPKMRLDDRRGCGSPLRLSSGVGGVANAPGAGGASGMGGSAGAGGAATAAGAARRALSLAGSSPTLPLRVPPTPLTTTHPGDSPLKMPVMRFDAPSPNGATDARVIVMESNSSQPELCSSGLMKGKARNVRKRLNSHGSLASVDSQRSANSGNSGTSANSGHSGTSANSGHSGTSANGRDSDSEGEMLADKRPRRQKKAVVYKEKPLNRKMRR